MYISPGIVVGFHGCDQDTFDSVIRDGKDLIKSNNSYDWLGQGAYFWEGSHERAEEWARASKSIEKPCVIGAIIQLGKCIDLLDSADLKKVKSTYEILEDECERLGEPLPINKAYSGDISFLRELDCRVIMRLHSLNNELIYQDLGIDPSDHQAKRYLQNHPQFIDSVRGMFPEGSELYDGAGFRDKNHIQLCIVNPNCVVGYFNPKKPNSWYKKL